MTEFTLLQKVALANQITSSLVGTCMRSLDNELEDSKAPDLVNDADFLRLFDDRCFECADCGWWHGTDDLARTESSDLLCYECSGEGDEE